MNERIVYLGSFNNSKKGELIEKSLDFLRKNRGDEFFYLLPNGDLLKKYRKHFIDSINYSFEMNLLTFDDIVQRFAGNEEYIDNAMKNLIIKNVLKDLYSKGNLKYFKNHIEMEGFVSSCNYIIGEVKRSLITSKEYLSRCPNRDIYLEIGYIYREYENILKNLGLLDREGQYFNAIKNLKKKKTYLKDLKFIIIDEFYDFRPIEIALLKELTKEDIDIYINIPFEMRNRSDILNNTLEILKAMNFKIEFIDEMEFNYFEELGLNLFGEIKNKFKNIDNLKIIEAQNKYLEIKKVFEFIKKDHHNGEKLEDMAIVVSHSDYMEVIHKVSQEDLVPINIPEKIQLNNLPLINEILNILILNFERASRKDIVNRVKSIYFPVLNEKYRERYEYILKKERFEDFHGLKKLLEEKKSLNLGEKYLEDLSKIIDSIEDQMRSIEKHGTIDYYNGRILDSLIEYKLGENILKRYEKTGNYEIFHRDIEIIRKLKEVLEKMRYLSIYIDEISLEDYYDYLLDHMKEEYIIEKHGNALGVQVLNPVNMRGFRKEIVFIVGLNGNYPVIEDENYYLNQYNQEDLESIGIDIKTYIEKLSNEEIKFASMVSSAKQKLYLSYNMEESSNVISIFLEELLSLIDIDNKDSLDTYYIDLEGFLNQGIEEITNKRELIRYILLNEIDIEDSNLSSKERFDLKKEIDIINKKAKGEVLRDAEEFNSYSGFLQDSSILEDLRDIKPGKYSISYLESYGRCPYAFMLNYIFNIKNLDIALEDETPMDIGNIYHEVLREFYTIYKNEINNYLKINSYSDENYKETIKNLIIKNGEDLNWDFSTGENKIILESVIEDLTVFIQKDFERMKKYNIIPYEFEVDFGDKDPININWRDYVIPIRGRIDRIDKIIGEEKYIVMDYKSSSYGARDIDSMIDGLSFQLPLYIISQEGKDIISGLYGIIRGGQFQIKLGIIGENPMISRRLKGAMERYEWEDLLDTVKDNIVKTIDKIQSGNFSIDPLECSPYCIYKDICRYKEVLEVENGDQ